MSGGGGGGAPPPLRPHCRYGRMDGWGVPNGLPDGQLTQITLKAVVPDGLHQDHFPEMCQF
jgi:hypothetical protein